MYLQRTHLWLLKLYSKYLLWYAVKYTEGTESEKLVAAKLTALNPELFKNYSNYTARMFKIQTMHPSVDLYLKDLRFLNYKLSSRSFIDLNWSMYEAWDVSLEAFFISSEDRHLDVVSSVKAFRSLAIEFFNLYYSLKSGGQVHDSFHFRILSKYEKVISTLVDDLLRYSHE